MTVTKSVVREMNLGSKIIAATVCQAARPLTDWLPHPEDKAWLPRTMCASRSTDLS